MKKDPIDTLGDALFIVGMLASLVLVVLPDRPRPRQCTREPLWCRCGGPLGPTGNPALDEAWAKARGK